MKTDLFLKNFDFVSQSSDGVPKLRQTIMNFAVQGKLTKRNARESAEDLIGSIRAQKKKERFKVDILLPLKESDRSNFLPENWSLVRLGECVNLISGQHLLPQEQNEVKKGIPYLTGPADFGNINPIATRWTESPKVLAEKGDVLVTVKGAGVGKTNILSYPKAAIGRQLMALRPIIVSSEFIYLIIRKSYSDMQMMSTGMTVPGIGRENILNYVVWFPPLEEQKRIVAKVDQLMALCDELEAKQEKQTHTRRQLNDAALNALLSAASPEEFKNHWQRIVDNFDLLYDDLENLNLLRQAILDLAFKVAEPGEELVQTSIGEMLVDIKYGTSKRCGPEIKGIPVLRIPNVVKGLINIDELKYGRLDKSEHDNLKLKEGDILIIRSNGSLSLVGKTAIVTKEFENYAYAGYLIRLRFDLNQILPEYVSYWFSSQEIRGIIERQANSTSGVNNINTKKIENLPFRLIPLEEQKRIVAKVDQLMALCDELEKKLTAKSSHLEKLADSLLRA